MIPSNICFVICYSKGENVTYLTNVENGNKLYISCTNFIYHSDNVRNVRSLYKELVKCHFSKSYGVIEYLLMFWNSHIFGI